MLNIRENYHSHYSCFNDVFRTCLSEQVFIHNGKAHTAQQMIRMVVASWSTPYLPLLKKSNKIIYFAKKTEEIYLNKYEIILYPLLSDIDLCINCRCE